MENAISANEIVLGLFQVGILAALWGIHKDLRKLIEKKDG